jgi:hypothetical protein
MAACFCLTTPALAAPSVSVAVDANTTIPNVVANSIIADGDGTDWTGTPLDYQNHGLTGAGQQTINATVWNTALTDTGLNRVGNISLTDDAQGTFTLGVAFAGDFMQRFITSDIVNGEMILSPTQGDLNRDGFVGINDLNTVLGVWNQNVTPGDPRAGDPSGDGFVGIEDLGHVLGSWNFGTTPPNHNPVEMELPGDLHPDGFVGLYDYKVPQQYWNLAVTPGDGFVGMDDLNVVLTYWNTGTPPADTTTVPEPGTLTLLAVGGALLNRRRRPTQVVRSC